MRHRGSFFSNFLNILMGLTIVPLSEQVFQPVHASFAAEKAFQTTQNFLADRSEPGLAKAKVELAKRWDDVVLVSGADISVPGERCVKYAFTLHTLEVYAEQDRNRMKPEGPDGKKKTEEERLPGTVRPLFEALREENWKNLLLVVIIAIFILKYVHESDRVDSLVVSENSIPSWIHLLFHLGRVLALAFAVVLARSATWGRPWWVPAFITFGFLLQDVGMLFARNRLIFRNGISRERFNALLYLWIGLDVVLLAYFGFLLVTRNSSDPVLLVIVLALQIFLPYWVYFDFYFADNFAKDPGRSDVCQAPLLIKAPEREHRDLPPHLFSIVLRCIRRFVNRFTGRSEEVVT